MRASLRAPAICFLSALCVAGAMPAAAPAAVQLGQTCEPNATSQITAIQTETAAGVPSARAPFTGVITSFSVLRHPTEAFQARLKVFRDNGTDSFTTVANGPLATLAPGLNVVPARVPIAAGDYIGTWGDPGTQRCNFVAMENRMESFSGPEPQPPETFSTNAFNGVIVDLSAQLEPDADGDVYGDETQDKCVGTAGAFNGCPNAFALGKPREKKGKLKVTATVPGAGTLRGGSASDQALATASKSKRQLKRVTRTLTSTSKQKVTLTLKLTKPAKRKLAEEGGLKVRVKVVYTPIGGPSGSRTGKARLEA